MATQEMAVKQKKEVEKTAGEGIRPGPIFLPAVDIFENENEIIVLADMPGVEGENVDIDLREGRLTIYGKVDLVEEEKETSVYREYGWGDYYRQFTLSDVVNQERITARMDQGVLRLVLPKVDKVKPQKIRVNSG